MKQHVQKLFYRNLHPGTVHDLTGCLAGDPDDPQSHKYDDRRPEDSGSVFDERRGENIQCMFFHVISPVAFRIFLSCI